METGIIYFLKANFILSLLYGLYFLLLRNEKFFTINRQLLLGCIALAFFLPLLPGNPGLFTQAPNPLPVLSRLNTAIARLSTHPAQAAANDPATGLPTQTLVLSFSYLQAALGIYLLIAALLFLRFIRQLFTIGSLWKKSEKQVTDRITLLYHKKDLPPFSFFNMLAINRSQYPAEEYKQVIAHERVHIQQRHTIDLLLAEITCILCWINPLAHKLKRSLKLNLEYLADEEVLRTGVDKRKYQLNILNSCIHTSDYRLANLFTSSKIKLRIKMMNKKNSPARNLYKYVFLVPVIWVAWFLTSPVNAQSTGNLAATHPAGNEASPRFKRLYIVIDNHAKKELLENIKSKLKDWDVDLTIKKAVFKDDLLTHFDFAINVAGAFKGAVSNGSDQPLTDPIIFYYEPKTGFHLSLGLPPGNISSYGEKIITNNLNGLLIEYPGGKELHGSCRWE
jgi:hypothetical protein